MPTQKSLIPPTLFSSKSFREDLRRLLSLQATDLIWLNSLADTPDGFSPAQQGAKLAERAGFKLEEANGALRLAEYLYERCREWRISPDNAIEQLLQAAPLVEVEDAAQKSEELRALLAAKDGYEAGRYANRRSTAVVAHFQGFDAVWDIRPIVDRGSGEVVAAVPVLIMNLSWHDMTGESHEATFQLDGDGWQDFKERIESIDRQGDVVRRYMNR